MSTSQTARGIELATIEIDTGIRELDAVKTLIAMESSHSSTEFDSGQDFSSIINSANTTIDQATDELKRAKSSLQAVAHALR